SDLFLIVDNITLHFVKIDAGCLDTLAASKYNNIDKICFEKFYILDSEVTQNLFEKIMGYNPSHLKRGGDYPLDSTTLNDVDDFIGKLSKKTGKRFRLPKEYEWEFVAMGKNRTRWSGTDSMDNLSYYAIFNSESSEVVKSRLPNDRGVYDMSGNVWEWVDNEISPNKYVIKGGGWNSKAKDLIIENRTYSDSGEG
ncbi:MAG: SUMF1/EgtB/PvdO family nonheme iron enzyme, partial [Calditerrivibrio sp.]|nr:SUMF1/EgtB/PvdO family nonheme iron enzyme [Calditerrivibrio sp.]